MRGPIPSSPPSRAHHKPCVVVPGLLPRTQDVPGGFESFGVLPSGYAFWLVALLGGVDFHMARDYSGEEEFPSTWVPEFPGDIRNEARHLPANAQSGVLQVRCLLVVCGRAELARLHFVVFVFMCGRAH